MKPFDGNEYRKRVMSRLLDDFSLADPHTGDPFLVCDVDANADKSSTLARIDAVVAFWQKDRNHPKYKGVAAQLVARRDDYATVLTDPSARAQAAARVHGARAESDAAVVEQLDKYAAALLRKHRGIPRSRVATLSAIAVSDGMTEAAFAQWVALHPVVEDADQDGAVPWEPAVRRQVRSNLDELARTDQQLTARCRTLLTFLGLGANSSVSDIATSHARLVEANRNRARDRVMTLTEDLLAQVSTRLLSPDGVANYVASLRADARDSLRDDLRRMAVLTGSLPAPELEAYSARVVGLGWGFTSSEARDLVREAAASVHLAVEVGGEVELIVCGKCHRPQAVSKRSTCSYCRAHLYNECPACSTKIPAASDICPSCSAPLAVWQAAAAAAPAAQTALDAGRVVEASSIAAEALAGVDPIHAPAPLRAVVGLAADQIDRATTTWAELHRDLNRGAVWAAAASATWLTRNATDFPDPAPTPRPERPHDAAGMLAFLQKTQDEATRAAADAADLPDEQAEPALGDILRRFPDCPQALMALAQLPLPEPRSVVLALVGGVATVTWEAPAAAPRSTKYRVEREVTWPAAQADHTTVGTTSATHLEDAAAPAGALVRYGVSAVDGNRSSKEVMSGDPVLVHRDIEVLHAEAVDGNVELSWPTNGLGHADLILEREVDPSSGLTVPTRRIRPGQHGHHVDEDVSFDVPYRYRLSLSYHTRAGELVRTEGRSVLVELRHPPKPVTDIWATTDDAMRTMISFQSPPSGQVRIYAAPSPALLSRFTTGTTADLDRAMGSVRLVGAGRRRVVDEHGRGTIAYRAVTVVGDQAVGGAALTHAAVAKPTGLRVVSDDKKMVLITFRLPAGVTEAFVCWRRDRPPAAADEQVPAGSGGGGAKVTNTKLQIDGGYEIHAPDDGRALFVAVYPALREASPSGGGRQVGSLTAAPVAATLEARHATPVKVTYQVKFAGLRRKRVEVQASCPPEQTLPKLVLVARTREPDHPRVGTLLAEHPGGGSSVTLKAEDGHWPTADFTVRLFATPQPGGLAEVVDPPEEARRLRR